MVEGEKHVIHICKLVFKLYMHGISQQTCMHSSTLMFMFRWLYWGCFSTLLFFDADVLETLVFWRGCFLHTCFLTRIFSTLLFSCKYFSTHFFSRGWFFPHTCFHADDFFSHTCFLRELIFDTLIFYENWFSTLVFDTYIFPLICFCCGCFSTQLFYTLLTFQKFVFVVDVFPHPFLYKFVSLVLSKHISEVNIFDVLVATYHIVFDIHVSALYYWSMLYLQS